MLFKDVLNIPCLLEFCSKDVFTEMLSTVVHFLNRDCGGSLILLISMFTFKFEFIPIGKLLNEFIGDGPFCSSGVAWGMTFSRKDFMVG